MDRAAANPRVDRLLDVATNEFAAQGLAGARVDRIARESGSNKQLVYYYFESKVGLWAAVLRRTIARTSALWQALPDTATPRQRLVDAAHRIAAPEAESWRRLLAWEALEGGGAEIANAQERGATWAAQVALTRGAQDRGQLDADLDAEVLTLALFSMQALPHMLPQVTRLMTGLDASDPRFQERLDALLVVLAERLAPPAAP
jgi:AcrR family transcriptional regulator